MKDVRNGVSLQQAARVGFDKVGQVKSHSCFVNDPGRMNQIEARTTLQNMW